MASPTPTREVRLNELRVGHDGVVIVARVVTASRREITRRSDGGRRPVLSGLLSDGSATVRFTWWDPPAADIDRGTVLRAGPVSVKEYNGRVELAFSWRTRVEPAAEAELPAIAADTLPLRPVAELRPPDEGFRLEVRVARVRPKSVTVGQERREIREGIVGDASGTLAFTAWTDFGLKEGEAIRVTGAYARAFRNRPQLVLDERATVERIPDASLPPVDVLLPAGPVTLARLEASRGAELASVEGIAIALLPPSGLVYRCPTCGRSVSSGLCRVHGTVAAAPDLRARVVLDDGSASATLNLDRAQTEALWGRTLGGALDRLRETPDPTLLEEELFTAVFGRRLAVSGRATVDDFGLTIYPESVRAVAPGAAERGAALRRSLAEGSR